MERCTMPVSTLPPLVGLHGRVRRPSPRPTVHCSQFSSFDIIFQLYSDVVGETNTQSPSFISD